MVDFIKITCYNERCMTAMMCKVADTLGVVAHSDNQSGNLDGASLY